MAREKVIQQMEFGKLAYYMKEKKLDLYLTQKLGSQMD